MDKEDVVHFYNGITTLAYKKNEIVPLAATRMDLEIIILSKVSQTEKDKYLMISLIGRILKEMIQMNLFTKKETVSQN